MRIVRNYKNTSSFFFHVMLTFPSLIMSTSVTRLKGHFHVSHTITNDKIKHKNNKPTSFKCWKYCIFKIRHLLWNGDIHKLFFRQMTQASLPKNFGQDPTTWKTPIKLDRRCFISHIKWRCCGFCAPTRTIHGDVRLGLACPSTPHRTNPIHSRSP